jgi:peptide-methionine (R)-S-oxide reductase
MSGVFKAKVSKEGNLQENDYEQGFRCAGCGNIIFLAKHKTDFRTGRPAFTEAVKGSVNLVPDKRLGAALIFVQCSKCGRHLGQIVDDSANPERKKYCVNCGSLDFQEG